MARKRVHGFESLIPVLLGILLVNAVVVDGYILTKKDGTGNVLGTTTDACPSACMAEINNLRGGTGTTAKEYYIPLGSGSNASREWIDVAGAGAFVDTASYRKIKTVTFEATVSQPTSSQRVWIRLFNVTDKHPVWYSEMSTESPGPVLVTSSPISLDPGNKYYQVQMKSQLQGFVNLLQGRIHVITK